MTEKLTKKPTKFAEIIELDEDEAKFLGYEDGDPISMTKTHDGYIIYRKNHYSHTEIKDKLDDPLADSRCSDDWSAIPN